jgi:hypothetical protein
MRAGYSGYNTAVASEIYKQVCIRIGPYHQAHRSSTFMVCRSFQHARRRSTLRGCAWLSSDSEPTTPVSRDFRASFTSRSMPSPTTSLPSSAASATRRLTTSSHARVILITPPPVDPVRTKTEIYDMISHPRLVGLDRSDELVKQYARVTKEVGDREGVPVIDAYTTIWAKAGGRDVSLLRPFFADGLHLNAEGNKVRSSSDMLKRPQALFVSQVVFELLMETISSQYPELKPENLPLGFPE